MKNTQPVEAVQSLNREHEYLVALSGGSDSVAALVVFTYLKLNVRACHVQHGDDETRKSYVAFCQELCKQLNVPLIVHSISIPNSKNWEATARELRYRALAEAAPVDTVLVTGHHLDDQIETFFLKALRGSGIRGLCCMEKYGVNPVVRTQKLVRPFLSISKNTLEHFLMENNFNWLIDRTNLDPALDRNYIRLDLLPQIEARWPNYREAISASITALQSDRKALLESFPPKTQSLEYIRALSNEQIKTWVMNCFATHGDGKCPSYAQVNEFVKQITSKTLKHDAVVEIKSGSLKISKVKDNLEVKIEKKLKRLKNEQ